LDRGSEQGAGDPPLAPARRDEKAVDAPGLRRGLVAQHARALQAREVRARTEIAPADRLVIREGEGALGPALLQQLQAGAAVGSPLAGLPGRAAFLHAPMHAPAAAARTVRAEQARDHAAIIRRGRPARDGERALAHSAASFSSVMAPRFWRC